MGLGQNFITSIGRKKLKVITCNFGFLEGHIWGRSEAAIWCTIACQHVALRSGHSKPGQGTAKL